MSGRPILPLFHVRKSFRSSLNEKTLITILLISSVFTLVIIFKNLPQSVVNEVQIKSIFIPELNNNHAKGGDQSKPDPKDTHINDKNQDVKNQDGQVAQPNVEDSAKDVEVRKKREKIKNVKVFYFFRQIRNTGC